MAGYLWRRSRYLPVWSDRCCAVGQKKVGSVSGAERVVNPPSHPSKNRLVPICRPAWRDLLRSRRVWFQPDSIVNGVAELLFAAKVAFRRLYGNLSQQ